MSFNVNQRAHLRFRGWLFVDSPNVARVTILGVLHEILPKVDGTFSIDRIYDGRRRSLFSDIDWNQLVETLPKLPELERVKARLTARETSSENFMNWRDFFEDEPQPQNPIIKCERSSAS